ncbi:MAG: RdgB/HAM1 family non-canonical purine NTP pyrophosphatase [Bacilli bacterium]|jgi:XTP/dITP diphosphohydrolase|nr:RdgB/HAM1 family non-canonical purine NTP pyrophosphatase [Bacilli bacterium]MCH4228529.1 RdgB/HAM1 family non-canonical purine NTP pyrophosphatase [Bacilli bacterium]
MERLNQEIVLATHNKNKLREYRELLSPLGYIVMGQSDLNITEEPVENGLTYEENALIKAKFLFSIVHRPVISDDSGIEIKALGEHFPGVHSARYAASISSDYGIVDQKVLDLMKDAKDRSAEYHCCICLIEKEGAKPLFFNGVCKGHILEEKKGHNGFGYDPIFHYDEGNLDFGVCSEEEKNAVSHRAIAFRKLLVYLSIQR